MGALTTLLLVSLALTALASAVPTAKSSLLLKRLARQVGDINYDDDDELVTKPTTPASTSPSIPKPEMYSLKVTSHIEHRFAKTLIASRLANPANQSQEIFFSVTLPESAFISKFLMEIEGKVYEAYVKEKQEAKQEYDQAIASGLGAAHVALSARDSNSFTVSVNIEPRSKVTFNLTYEELLTRRLGAYNHVVNLDPGQVVRELTVDVFIKESKNITTLRVPELRSGNEVDANELTKANPLARIERKSPTEAHISFAPTAEQQKELGQAKKQEETDQDGRKDKDGLGGQFVVQYDVDREGQAGEILVNNGYFVHFFAPKDLAPLRKHALFVLDVSGSMGGRKIEQLKQAMNAILDDLNEGDYFNIIEFSYSVTVWNLDSTPSSAVFSPYNAYNYDAPAPNPGPTPAFPATPEYVAKAKEIVNKMRAGGGTNIFDTLKTVIKVAHTGLENITTLGEEKREPIIVFLTDGEPTVGETRLDKIFSVVQELNIKPEAAIFSLAFGDDADLGFLKKLSLKNAGFARKIYEASDAALQLRDFYRQIASPLLANVTFNYVPDKIVKDSTTKVNFHTLFSGSELVVAGKLSRRPDSPVLYDELNGEILGISSTGSSSIPIIRPNPIDFIPSPPTSQPREASSLERLWAYLTIKQLLEQDETNAVEPGGSLADKMEVETSNGTTPSTPKQMALELALKYSFVTRLTSLVVVKPNETKSTGVESINPVDGGVVNKFSGNFGPVDRVSMQGIPLPLLSQGVVQHFSYPQPVAGLAGPASGFASSSGASFGGFGGGSFLGTPGPSPLRPTPRPPRTTTRPSFVVRPETEDLELGEELQIHEEMTTVDSEPAITVSDSVTIDLPDWLPLVSNNTHVSLPFGENDTDVTYKLFKDAISSESKQECKTPGGDQSSCLYLHKCVLAEFKTDIAAYKPYFCAIDGFAGVCCPENATEAKPQLDTSFNVQPESTELPHDPGFYPNHETTKQPNQLASSTSQPEVAKELTSTETPLNPGNHETTEQSSTISPKKTTKLLLESSSKPQPESTKASTTTSEPPLDSGIYPVTDIKEPHVEETGSSTLSELPNDPGFYPLDQGSQNVNLTQATEEGNPETSALNPGFHPVYDMKTSIVEPAPKPV